MKILIVAPFASLPGEPYFNRFLYLSNQLAKKHDVTLVTSKFRHFDKKFRSGETSDGSNFDTVLIPEAGYKKNVSFARLLSHRDFSLNFAEWFKKQQVNTRYDVVYAAFPLIKPNIFLAENKSRYKYKLIVDVQDVWPESISSALPVVGIIPDSWVPFSWRANAVYRGADALVAVSQTYMNRASRINKSCPKLVTYIGSDAALIEGIAPFKMMGAGVHFLYIGTLSHSYDMQTVIQAFSYFLNRKNYVLHILGEGPETQFLKHIAPDNVKFHGFLPYSEMIAFAKSCDVFINPIRKTAKQSVTNKLSDYIILNKIIISSQTNTEVKCLLSSIPSEEFSAGNVPSFIAAAERAAMQLQTENVIEKGMREKFDRSCSYLKLVKFIEDIVEHG
jgi:glycosyltransferase involved in cell wall biosynthesis